MDECNNLRITTYTTLSFLTKMKPTVQNLNNKLASYSLVQNPKIDTICSSNQ